MFWLGGPTHGALLAVTAGPSDVWGPAGSGGGPMAACPGLRPGCLLDTDGEACGGAAQNRFDAHSLARPSYQRGRAP